MEKKLLTKGEDSGYVNDFKMSWKWASLAPEAIIKQPWTHNGGVCGGVLCVCVCWSSHTTGVGGVCVWSSLVNYRGSQNSVNA